MSILVKTRQAYSEIDSFIEYKEDSLFKKIKKFIVNNIKNNR